MKDANALYTEYNEWNKQLIKNYNVKFITCSKNRNRSSNIETDMQNNINDCFKNCSK